MRVRNKSFRGDEIMEDGRIEYKSGIPKKPNQLKAEIVSFFKFV